LLREAANGQLFRGTLPIARQDRNGGARIGKSIAVIIRHELVLVLVGSHQLCNDKKKIKTNGFQSLCDLGKINAVTADATDATEACELARART
jgi:hypothetical protein